MSRPAVAFLILAHRGPEQLGRQARRLLSPRSSIYLHIDRKTQPALFSAIRAALPEHPHLHLLDRMSTPWASWNTVEAYLRGLQRILDEPEPPEHIVLFSGQDYLLRPVERIVDFLEPYAGQTFAATWPMPSDVYGPDGGMWRIRYWHTPIRRRRFRIPLPRPYPAGVRPYGGSAFMVLDRATAQSILDYTREHPEVPRFHHHVWAVDEHYLQTALNNCERSGVVIGEHLWHMEWTLGAAHPHTFTLDDFERLADSARNSSEAGGVSRAKLFARKFHDEVDSRILDRIDEELLSA
ncbi:hypothetical protein DVA67_018510 [Solirubrobacter sp. CPCC 204708]|uniref:Peptide O-xylosyltransferase n=1 Tax=Solirubrobacter deserti TaxID=2282478 RepID=A0ABT4RMA0_9ACTN|nr:beta-1,6-N-acetylglucosaminyltransferase [Solirubrobacter deserti]MBE2317980.1 hypothetical protein [Solirubrobacter deserti]MDA0139659.1 beta-1,6-N-acetylglucosaminyltransferase [Solirubrobacter deserti]